jgi:6-phosphogluconolactonase (cycloisomerase 2 family)
VTEKNTNLIDVFAVGNGGFTSAPVFNPSAGQTPFGFAFNQQGVLIVSEAFGGAVDASAVSSYTLGINGTLSLVSASVPTTETAACWVAVTNNGKFAFASNTGSASVTGYQVNQGASRSRRRRKDRQHRHDNDRRRREPQQPVPLRAHRRLARDQRVRRASG